MAMLKAAYNTRAEAEARIPAAFEKYYQEKYPGDLCERQAEVEHSARGVLAVLKRNIFPEMKVTWGAYPNNIGHTDFPGCFRCHDDQHAAAGRPEDHAGLQRLPQPAGHGRSRAEDSE